MPRTPTDTLTNTVQHTTVIRPMELNITITHVLPPAVTTLIERMIAAIPAEEAATTDPEPAKVARKPRASKPEPAAKPAEKPDPVAEPEPAAEEEPAKQPASKTAPTFDDLKAMVQTAMNTVGTPAVREVFAKFKIKRLADLDQKKFSAMAKALTEIQDLTS